MVMHINIENAFIDNQTAMLFVKNQTQQLIDAAKIIRHAWELGGKLLIFGNGGSAASAQHIASEFMGKFQNARKALPALALTTDTSIITSLSNDYGFDYVFARQLEGIATNKDVVLALTTSGKSKNIILGLEMARELGCFSFAFTGEKGDLSNLVELILTIPGLSTARVQEAHVFAGHLLCQLLD